MLARAVDSLQTALGANLVSIVLFGSRARGDSKKQSDWDLLVIANELPKRYLERHLFLRTLLAPELASISFVAKTQREFESYLPSLYLDIALDGKILYDPDGYAFSRIKYLRNLIVKSGLVREHSTAGDTWRWSEQPMGEWELEWAA